MVSSVGVDASLSGLASEPATNPFDVLVIKTWMPNMPFLYFDRTHVFTGTCEVVNAAD